MNYLKNGVLNFVDRVYVPGENWSIGVPEKCDFSTDKEKNGSTKTNPSGVYDLIIVRPRSREKADFSNPYEHTVAFVTLDVLTYQQLQQYTFHFSNWITVKETDDIKVSFTEFMNIDNILNCQVLIATESHRRRCQILVSGVAKKEEKIEFVRQFLDSINFEGDDEDANSCNCTEVIEESDDFEDDDSLFSFDGNRITVNNRWSFEIPAGMTYKTDAEFDCGIPGGVDLAGSVKPMVLEGKCSDGRTPFGIALQPHYDYFGNGYSIIDCKYDNRFQNTDGGQRIIVIDEDDFYVDYFAENLIFMGIGLDIRVRETDEEAYDFHAFIPKGNSEQIDSIRTCIEKIAHSVTFLNMEIPTGTEKKQKIVAANPDFIISDGVVVKYIGNSENVVFPEGISEICDSCCSGKSGIVSIVIPEGVTRIGNRAFENCLDLEKAVLPSTLTELGYYCFVDCHKLESINLQDTKIENIGSSTFSECFVLDNVKLPKTVKYIDAFAFKNCHRFTEFVVPSGCTGLGLLSFGMCRELKYLFIPESVVTFEESWKNDKPFSECNNLTVYGPASSEGEKYCLTGNVRFCVSDTPKIVGPSDIPIERNNGGGLFSSLFDSLGIVYESKPVNQKKEDINSLLDEYATDRLPDIIEDVEFVFAGLGKNPEDTPVGKEVLARKGIISPFITDKTWYFIVDPKHAEMSEVQEAFDRAKNDCFLRIYRLDVFMDGIGLVAENTNNRSFASDTKEKIEYYQTTKNDFTVVDDNSFRGYTGNKKNIILPLGFKKVPWNFLEQRFCVEHIKIPEGYTSVDDFALSMTRNIKTVEFPKTLKTIGKQAFFGCEDLEEIIIPSGVKTICYGAFFDCHNLKKVIISDGVEEIEETAFSNCPIEELHIPASVKKIGQGAFNCPIKKLTVDSLDWAEHDEKFWMPPIDLNETLEELIYGNGITKIVGNEIGEYEFENLKKVKLPSTLPRIDFDRNITISSCSELIIPEGIREIDLYSFYFFNELECLKIPASVEYIFCSGDFEPAMNIEIHPDNPYYRSENNNIIEIPGRKEKIEEIRKAEEARRIEENRKAEEARKAEAARKAEEIRKAEEARKIEEARKAEESRRKEELRKVEEARKAEEARKSEEARKAEELKRKKEEYTALKIEKHEQEKIIYENQGFFKRKIRQEAEARILEIEKKMAELE